MRKHPLRVLLDRLGWPWKGAPRAFDLDQVLIQALQGLAEQEQRPADEVAAELLSFALAQKNASQELMQLWQMLSPREQQVAALTCLGWTNRQIAARLGISPDTVKTHIRNILTKFDLHSKADLRLRLAEWDFSEWDLFTHRSHPSKKK